MKSHLRGSITILCSFVLIVLCIGLKPLPDFQAAAAMKGQKPSSYLYEKARRNRLLLVGTQHSNNGVQNLITQSLPGLVSMGGVNTLFVEIPSDQQPVIDRFMEGAATIQDIRMWPIIATDAYRQLIIKARDLGLDIVAIDNNTDTSVPRDTWMAQRVTEFLNANPEARGMIVVGNRHVLKNVRWTCGRSRTLADNLSGFKPFCVIIWPGSMDSAEPVGLDLDPAHFDGVKDPTLNCINLEPDISLPTVADGIILMPKEQPVTAQLD
jgi:hypothetical protein